MEAPDFDLPPSHEFEGYADMETEPDSDELHIQIEQLYLETTVRKLRALNPVGRGITFYRAFKEQYISGTQPFASLQINEIASLSFMHAGDEYMTIHAGDGRLFYANVVLSSDIQWLIEQLARIIDNR